MNTKVKHTFTVLRISSEHYKIPNGREKTFHFFEKVLECNSLDSCVTGILTLSDGYFRIIRRANKKFLPTLNVRKVGNIIYF